MLGFFVLQQSLPNIKIANVGGPNMVFKRPSMLDRVNGNDAHFSTAKPPSHGFISLFSYYLRENSAVIGFDS